MVKLPIKILLTTSIVFVVLIMFSLAQEMNRRIQVKREVARLEQEVKELNKSLVEMENLNHYFGSEAYKERMAREKLNYKAPGEEVVLVPEEQRASEEGAWQELQEVNDDSIPLKWWNTFFVDPQREELDSVNL